MNCASCPHRRDCHRQCMDLPEGMTCADCTNIDWCSMAYGTKPTDRKCGWEPIRFKNRKEDQMSHFSCAVFTKTESPKEVGRLMEPFNENTKNQAFLEFCDETEKIRRYYETASARRVKLPTGGMVSKYKLPHHYGADGELIFDLPAGAEEIEIPYKDLMSFDEYAENEECCTCFAGRYGYWDNPNRKWDYYLVGGCVAGLILLKDGAEGIKGRPSMGELLDGKKLPATREFSGGKVCDIDFEAMAARDRARLEPYAVARSKYHFGERVFDKNYPTEEIYIKQNTTFHTYAVVTPDGKWHAPGEVGWWGISTATPEEYDQHLDAYEEQFIKPAIKEGWYMTILDCHI